MLKITLKGSSGLSVPEDKPGHGAGEGGHTVALRSQQAPCSVPRFSLTLSPKDRPQRLRGLALGCLSLLLGSVPVRCEGDRGVQQG